MEIFTCAFFGHRDFYAHTLCEPKLLELLNDILSKHEFTEFLVGRNGEFDRFVASLVHRVKGDNCSMTLVLPYITADFSKNQQAFENYFDSVEICEQSSQTHFKSAITIRNHHIIDRSDLVICYLEHHNGGAYEAVRYAYKTGKTIINLYDKKHP
ncbi:MAG: hypothetical protein E7432_06950 [Ruminococcaceae bacterium]|nr:hypothetical protein [Oscillospiraceae bacterium]